MEASSKFWNTIISVSCDDDTIEPTYYTQHAPSNTAIAVSYDDEEEHDESLIARDRDISTDPEYHHVLTQQPQVSIIRWW